MKKLNSCVMISLIFVLLAGCQKNSTTGSNNGAEGSLVVRITDGPFPISLVDEANVTISKIEIRKANENEGFPFITVSDDTHKLNLINLRNAITQDLPEVKIPVGTYNLVRLYVADASIVVGDKLEEEEQVYDLTVPSGAETGIKIFIDPPITIESGLTSELLLDFDLSKSFEVQGDPNTPAGINGFHFDPVIRAVNNMTTGRILGVVTDTASGALADAQVWVEQQSVIASTFTSSEGLYALMGLPAGTYSAYATKAGYDTVAVSNVDVVAGNRTPINFALTPQ
ncbi:DUF4382 domain-containing protein [candidate division KSB1 bacterium]|nr:DUF4382 domain-containing protein [candidate division KSB1 bacterium]